MSEPIKAIESNLVQAGNTMRLNCDFRSQDDILVDPHDLYINIYTYKYELIKTIPKEEIERADVGEYHYNFTVPQEETRLVYEWVGNINGELFKKRRTVKVVFLDD